MIITIHYGADWDVDCVELPAAGVAHAAASCVHSSAAAWEFTHATIFVLISVLTELLRLFGKWKKLHVGYVHVFPSYTLRQHKRVNLFGRVGWGKIGCWWLWLRFGCVEQGFVENAFCVLLDRLLMDMWLVSLSSRTFV